MASGISLHEVEKKRPPGFFPKVYENVCKTLKEAEVDKMTENIKDPESLLKITHGLKNFQNSLIIKEFYPEKNPHECKVKREYGNKAYQDGKSIEALYLYTQAVVSAPCDPVTCKSPELSIALANRSAVLFTLKAYPLALDDIRLALESGYPNDLRYKLLERKAKILMFYRQLSDAYNCYKELLKALDVAKLDQDKKMKVQKDAQRMMEFFRKAPSVYNDPNVQIRPVAELPKLPGRNKKYPAVSDAIDYRYEPGRGRYAVAARNIEVGEYLCVEKPIVSHMLPEYMGSNCTNCFKIMKAPLPCPVCTKVLFCSYRCREAALTTYHPYECTLVDFLIASGMSVICFLAYRCISQKPLQFFLDNRDLFKVHDVQSGWDKAKVEKYMSMDYKNLYNLVSHHDERKTGDIFHRSMFAIMLLRCLKKVGYFAEANRNGPTTYPGSVQRSSSMEGEDEELQPQLSPDEAYIASLLCHFLEVLQFNAHEVAQFEMLAPNREEGATSVFIGAAVYPTLAMFNHSCDPTIVRYYVEDTVCVQAIKNVAKGEEICENYGPIFFHSSRDDRQERLKQLFWFECQCIPCKENWPLMHEMTDETLNFRCVECGGTVPMSTSSTNPLLKCSCGTPVRVIQTLKVISETETMSEKAKKALDEGRLQEAQDLFCKYLTTLDKYLAPPYADYYKIQQLIWKCTWLQHGNRVIRKKAVKVESASDDYDVVD